MHNRTHIHVPPSIGAKIADRVTAAVGSFPFLILHAIWFGLWIGLRVEPFPFGLLTMIVSLEAIALATLVMISQNRQAERDRLRDNHEAEIVDTMPALLSSILELVKDVHEIVQAVHQINLRQSEILTQQSEILDLQKAQQPDPHEEMMRKNTEMIAQIDQMLKRIRAVDKLKPGS